MVQFSTRGLFFSGSDAKVLLQYNSIFTIATFGNATDFGDLSGNNESGGAYLSSTRGLYGGGSTPTKINNIEFVTIASTGNATDFGDLTRKRIWCRCFSDVHGGLGD